MEMYWIYHSGIIKIYACSAHINFKMHLCSAKYRQTRVEFSLMLHYILAINSRFTQQCNLALKVYADFYSLLAATIPNSVVNSYKMQLSGCHNDYKMRNMTSVETQTSKVPTQVSLLLFP